MNKEKRFKEVVKYVGQMYGKLNEIERGIVWFTLCYLEENENVSKNNKIKIVKEEVEEKTKVVRHTKSS